MDIKAALVHKVWILPVWAWALVGGGGGYLLYRHYQNAQAQASNNPTDPYSSYNTSEGVNPPQYPDAYGGSYPLSGGGGGGGFDPTSFEEGLQLGSSDTAGLGTNGTTTDSNDGSNSSNGAGPATTPAQGNDPTTHAGNKHTGQHHTNATSKRTPTNHKKKAETKKREHHPATHKHTSTGGGMPNRHRDQHTKTPRTGAHKPTSHHALGKGKGTIRKHEKVVHKHPVTGHPVARSPHPTHPVHPTHPAHPGHPGHPVVAGHPGGIHHPIAGNPHDPGFGLHPMRKPKRTMKGTPARHPAKNPTAAKKPPRRKPVKPRRSGGSK